jgi:hypothetical protein
MNLWRSFLGWKAALYLFAVFFVTLAASAVVIEYLFDAFGWVPDRLAKEAVLGFDVTFDLTSVMTVVMVLVTGGLWWARREREEQQGPGDDNDEQVSAARPAGQPATANGSTSPEARRHASDTLHASRGDGDRNSGRTAARQQTP